MHGYKKNEELLADLYEYDAAEEVVGFIYPKSVLVRQLLGAELWYRNFSPALEEILNSLAQELENGRDQLSPLNKNLLKAKYLNPGSDPHLKMLDKNAEDYLLHLVYIQPWRLFAVTPKIHEEFQDCPKRLLDGWYLMVMNASGKKEYFNLAPYFRAQIRIIIANWCEKSEWAKDFPCPSLQEMSRTSPQSLLDEPLRMSGNKEGWYSFEWETDGDTSDLWMVVEKYLSYYALGRLFFGQQEDEVHHMLAKQYSQSALGYWYYWFVAHLNLHFIKAWIVMIYLLLKAQWQEFKHYIKGEGGIKDFLFNGLLFIGGALLCVFCPLMVVLPIVCGIFSMPFTYVRTLCLHSDVPSLKHYFLLKCLDFIECLKDLGLFFWVGLPIVNRIAAAAIGIVPQPLFFSSTFLMFSILIVCLAFLVQNSYAHGVGNLAWRLASTHAMRLTGFLSLAAFFLYSCLGFVLKGIRFCLPTTLLDGLGRVISWVEKQFFRAEQWFHHGFLSELMHVADTEIDTLNKRDDVTDGTVFFQKKENDLVEYGKESLCKKLQLFRAEVMKELRDFGIADSLLEQLRDAETEQDLRFVEKAFEAEQKDMPFYKEICTMFHNSSLKKEICFKSVYMNKALLERAMLYRRCHAAETNEEKNAVQEAFHKMLL
jgi:hypothetical protein